MLWMQPLGRLVLSALIVGAALSACDDDDTTDTDTNAQGEADASTGTSTRDAGYNDSAGRGSTAGSTSAGRGGSSGTTASAGRGSSTAGRGGSGGQSAGGAGGAVAAAAGVGGATAGGAGGATAGAGGATAGGAGGATAGAGGATAGAGGATAGAGGATAGAGGATAGGAGGATAGAGGATAGGAGGSGTASVRLTDAQIAAVTSVVNDGEIRAGMLALTRAQNAQARDFAQMMVAMHTAAQARQVAVLAQIGVAPAVNPVSAQMMSDAEATLSNLDDADQDEFDRLYITSQVDMHQKTLQAIDAQLLPSVTAEPLRVDLMTTRGEVATHLQQAMSILSSLGGTVTDAGVSP